MAVETTNITTRGSIKVNDGTTTSGQPRQVSIALSALNNSKFTQALWDASAQKIINIADAISGILDRMPSDIQITQIDSISEA